jgi:TonB family protein
MRGRSHLTFVGLAFSLHAMALLIVGLVPPDPWGLAAEELLGADDRFAPFATEAIELVVQVEVEVTSPSDEPATGAGQSHLGERGEMGDRDAPRAVARAALTGQRRETDAHMAREWPGEVEAATSGVLAVIRDRTMPMSPFGDDVESGRDPENALGVLAGSRIGDSFGYGGLGVRGTGRGGGGDGAGTIGLGGLGHIGPVGGGGGVAGGCGGTCSGSLRRRTSSVPTAHFCGPGPCVGIRGSLSKEVIRRHVRRNINAIRFCYEQELIATPDLEGRVAVRFVISGQGAVVSSAVASSTLGDPAAERCVARAVERIGFPETDDGLPVVVTYPFVFTSVD